MVKTTKINVLSASRTSETVTKKTFAANERFIGSTTPRLRKLLTGICVGHAILLVATSTVFGVLLKAQVSIAFKSVLISYFQ